MVGGLFVDVVRYFVVVVEFDFCVVGFVVDEVCVECVR